MEAVGDTVTISAAHAWYIFGACVLVYGVFTAILMYHWRRYGNEEPGIRIAQRVYVISSGVLLVAALLSVIVFAYGS